MSISSKHHYIPVFYLKGFTNESGTFAIYDKKKDSLKRPLFYPKSHFFEENRNTLDINGKKTDFIEKGYQILEEKTKSIFKELQQANGHIKLNSSKIFDLQLFILSTYWRIPKTDGKLNSLLNSYNLSYFGINLVKSQTGKSVQSKRIDELLKTNGFIEGLRPIFPILQFTKTRNNEDLENWNIYYSGGSNVHITGDNPIVIRNSSSQNLLSKELIIPLTNKQILIRSYNKFITKTLAPEFSLKLDLLIFRQSSIYVCSKNPDYLISLSKLDKTLKQSTEQLKFSLFQYLDVIT